MVKPIDKTPDSGIRRVLFGVRKGDLYIAIERGAGPDFFLVHEQALGASVVRSDVTMSRGTAKRIADVIAAELAKDAEHDANDDAKPDGPVP